MNGGSVNFTNPFVKRDENGDIYQRQPSGRGAGRVIGIIIAVMIVVVLGSMTFYNVGEQEQAVLTMFGRIVRTDTAGLYFKIPLLQQVNKELLHNFKKYNRLEYYDRWLYSSMHVYNNFRPEGIRCGFGVFGVVVPTVNFNDLLLRVGPVRRDYNQPAINSYGEDEYFGTTPDLIFHEGEY